MVMSLIGFFPSLEKTKPVSLVRSSQRLRSNATTGAESGTTWVSPAFIRSAGMVHTAFSRSNSVHTARRVSLDRTAL